MYVTSTMYFDRLNAEQLRVLVVEPKELVAARLKTQLERLGHLVLGPAKDGQEAVAVAQRLNPSLVLIDSKLPGGDGIETARAIVAERPVPVILVTDYPGAELVRRAREAGVVAYLSPVERRPLLTIIEAALKRFDELRIVQQEARDASDALLTRRLVDNAKRVLVTRLGISDAEAFQRILERKLSMGRSLRDTAWTIIEAEGVVTRHDFALCLKLIFHMVRQDWRSESTRQTR
jgi:AmiR/NasT family two-component response regulator